MLAHVPNCDPNRLAAEIIERRPSADADSEESGDIVRAINAYLVSESRREDDEAVSEIAGSEIVRVMEESGNWQVNDSYSQAANARKCMSVVKAKLLGRGVMMPVETESPSGNTRQKRVRVDGTGRPTPTRSNNQSLVYGWVWDKAEAVLEDAMFVPPSLEDEIPI